MVNPAMVQGAFSGVPKPVARALQPVPAQTSAPDPDVEKLRKFMLKWLSILVGGAAIMLIVWRVILKFI